MLLHSSLVRLLTDNQSPRNPLGAGCLVSISSRYVLTCAHVVAQVLNIDRTSPHKPSTPLYLDFPLLAQQPLVQAVVEDWRPVRTNPVAGEIEDIALLKLTANFPLPIDAHPVQLSTAEEKLEQVVKLFGFPSGKLEGVYLDGQVKGMTGTGQVEIHIEPGHGNVQGGFSGSPVWNADKTEVLGLLQEISDYDGTIHAYMIPATTLRHVFGAQIIENPYRGLAAFRQVDANVFFGRVGEIQELLRLVKERRFTALVGVSGSGKSSVVFAGLVPQLQESQWQVIECRPGSDPFNHLAVALVKLLTTDKLEQAKQLTMLEKELPTGETKLSALVQVWQEESHKRLLLIIDQFEELYTANSTSVQQQFMARLLNLVNSEMPAVLLLTLRADFMNQALTYPEFAQALNGNTRFISSMSRTELEEVIEAPAAQVGLRLETGLTETILKDLGTEGGRLPLLQFALTRLFEKQHLGSLTHEAYTEIGGVEQALVKHAEQEFAHFSASEHSQLRQIFVQLVHPGQGTEDTRRVVIHSQLADKWAVVKKLADSRLVVTGRDNTIKQETVEVIHEALIRHWPRLQEWMKEDRAFRVWQDEFQVDLQRWQALKKPRAELLQGAKLAQAEEMLSKRAAELSEVEQAFIKAGRQEQQRQKKVWQVVFVGLLGLLMVSLITGMFGWWQWREAVQQKREAIKQTKIATEQAQEAEQQRRVALEQTQKATEQTRIALAGKLGTQAILAAQSPSPANGFFDQAPLLAVQSLHLLNSSNTKGSLSYVLQATAHIQRFFHGHQSSVTSVAFSSNDHRVISRSSDNTLILWDVATGQPIEQTWQGLKETVTSVAFSSDGQRVISGISDNTLILSDVATGQRIGQPWQGHKSTVKSVAFSADGQHIISSSKDKTLILWDVATGQAIGQPWQEYKSVVESVAFSADGQRVISGSEDGTLKLWDVATGQPIGQPWQGHKDRVTSVAFSADGRHVISGSLDNTLILWDVATGRLLGQPWQGHKNWVTSVAFSANGQHVISGSSDNNLILWDVATGQPLEQPWQGHKDTVWSVVFSGDGQHIISGSSDNTLILWDVATGPPLVSPWEGWRGEKFSNLPISNEYNDTILEERVNIACRKVNRNFTLAEWTRFLGDRPYEKTCPQFPSSLALARLQEGEDLAAKAESSDIEAAIVKFQEAFALDPELQKHPLYRFNPEVEAKRIAASAWVSKGESLAEEEKLDEAIAAFKRAQTLDASLKFDPQTKANQSSAPAFVDKGVSLAREGKIDEAIVAFKRALALDASLKFDPQTKANQSSAPTFVDKGVSLAREGKIDEAIVQYAKAQQLDPYLQVTARQWTELCGYGTVYQQAAKVMEACEKAVASDPQNFEYRDSRGLARALTGEVKGAIEDFQFFVEKTGDAKDKAQRQRWIEALRKGENPFTAEVLKELRGE